MPSEGELLFGFVDGSQRLTNLSFDVSPNVDSASFDFLFGDVSIHFSLAHERTNNLGCCQVPHKPSLFAVRLNALLICSMCFLSVPHLVYGFLVCQFPFHLVSIFYHAQNWDQTPPDK